MKRDKSLLLLALLVFILPCCALAEKGTHNPGKTCTWPGCHGYEAPAWQYSGTVFAAQDRSTPARDVEVVIEDTDGEYVLKTNSAGNFYTLDGAPSNGYSASITDGAQTLTMGIQQSSGACNSCHSPDGSAPPLLLN